MLLRDYFNPLTFYKSGELSRNQIGRSGLQVKKENEKFTAVRSRSPQNLECGHFMLLFCRGQQRNVPKCKTHVQSDCFCSLNLLFCSVVVVSAMLRAAQRDICLNFWFLSRPRFFARTTWPETDWPRWKTERGLGTRQGFAICCCDVSTRQICLHQFAH